MGARRDEFGGRGFGLRRARFDRMLGVEQERAWMTRTDHMIAGVRALRPFLPAKDFGTSRRFYEDLGFRAEPLGEKLVELHLGPFSVLLQDYFVEAWAANAMMHLLVDDLEAWWTHIASLDLPARYGVEAPRAPRAEPWGLTVAYVFDPSGVLWHVAELSPAS